jgi:hypothetical protein
MESPNFDLVLICKRELATLSFLKKFQKPKGRDMYQFKGVKPEMPAVVLTF